MGEIPTKVSLYGLIAALLVILFLVWRISAWKNKEAAARKKVMQAQQELEKSKEQLHKVEYEAKQESLVEKALREAQQAATAAKKAKDTEEALREALKSVGVEL